MEKPQFNITSFFKKNSEKDKFSAIKKNKLQKIEEVRLNKIIKDSIDLTPGDQIEDQTRETKELGINPSLNTKLAMQAEVQRFINPHIENKINLPKIEKEIDNSKEMKDHRLSLAKLIIIKSQLKNLEDKLNEAFFLSILKDKQKDFRKDENKIKDVAQIEKLKKEIEKIESELENIENNLDPKLKEERDLIREEINKYYQLLNNSKYN